MLGFEGKTVNWPSDGVPSNYFVTLYGKFALPHSVCCNLDPRMIYIINGKSQFIVYII